MPRNAVGAFIGVAVLIFVMAFAVGAFDPDARETRFVAGACDIPAQNVGEAVSLTVSGAISDGNYESFQVPEGTFFEVPANKELRICQIFVNDRPGPGNVLRHLHIGYGDDGVIDAAGAPTNPVELAHLPANEAQVEGIFEFATLIGVIPAGKFPFVTYMPGGDWEVFAVGVLSDVTDE